MTTIAEILGDALRTMSAVELARLLGVSEAALSLIRSGQRSGLGRVGAALLAQFPERREEILRALGFTGRTT